jgi:hypothetical protein
MRIVDPATLPRQPKFTGNYGRDLALLRATLSPQTWEVMHLPPLVPGGLARLKERARIMDANEEAVLLWNNKVKQADQKWTSHWRQAETVLIDFFDTESIAIARWMYLHRDGFKAHIRLTGEVDE